MSSAKIQSIENKEVTCIVLGQGTRKKRGPQNEGISLWFAENKAHKKWA